MTKYDLTLGDWVRIGNGEPTRVTELAHDYVRVAGMFSDQAYGHVEPIPITKEILEKNGFKIDMYSTLQLGDGKWLEYYHHESRLRMWWKGIDEWENHAEVTYLVFQCHVWYVHELQHALRLCKIDKEIKL